MTDRRQAADRQTDAATVVSHTVVCEAASLVKLRYNY